VLSIIFGVLMTLNPVAGALAVAWIIGIYSIVFGLTLVSLALRLRPCPRNGQGLTPE
jgi:uncharacterized membrane protein HdeD (DUF308 family)